MRLGVIHPGRLVPKDFNLRPAEVALPSVDKAFLWSPGIAYLHIASFEGKTPEEVATALDGMDAPHLKGLLLDLRDNHGGIVDSAAAVASLFLKQGELVLTTRGRASIGRKPPGSAVWPLPTPPPKTPSEWSVSERVRPSSRPGSRSHAGACGLSPAASG